MRITITTTDTALSFMRRAGYGYQKEGSGEMAFVRRVSGSPFPRYHAYVMERERKERGTRNLEINLHVDQKAPTYQRGRAHAGEYDGSLVEQEAARLRALAAPGAVSDNSSDRGVEKREEKKKGGFWERLLGQ